MKPRNPSNRRLATAIVVSLAIVSTSLQAAVQYYDGATSTVWDNSTANWGNTSGGPYTTNVWATYNEAVFEGTGTTVTLASPICNRITFNTNGYTLTGSTLGFGNPGGNSVTVASGVTATIASNISHPYGTGIRLAGTGTLILNGTNSISGPLIPDFGSINITGGATTAGSMWVGDSTGSNGTLNLSSGTLTVSGGATVGTRGIGAVVQSGGISNFNGGLALGYYNLGTATTATVNLSAGNMNTNQLGTGNCNTAGCSSIYTQTGGTFTLATNGSIWNGNWGGGVQQINVSGGIFDASAAAAGNTYLSVRGTSSMTISGTADVRLKDAVFSHPSTGSTATLNLDGGTLTCGTIIENNAGSTTSTFNLNGGTLKASVSSTDYLKVDTANVMSGGAKINTNGNDITITQPLLDGGGGLTKSGSGILTLSTAPSYAGTTTINAGTLALGSGVELNSASSLTLAAGATLDVSASSTWTLGSSASLSASGTGTTIGTDAATITGDSVGTVNLGSRPISLTWGGAAAGTDSSHPALTVSQGTLELSGNQITVVNPTALDDGVYTLITAPAITGTLNPAPLFTGGAGVLGGKTGTLSISGNSVILTVAEISATITATGTLAPVTGTYGTASNETSFTLSGSNLTAGIAVTPPAGYEVSTTSGSGYSGSGVTLTVGSPPTVSSTTVYVRLASNTPVAGAYNAQNITLTSPGALGVDVPTAAAGNSVTAKALTIGSASAYGKAYDGTTAATVTGELQASEDFGTGTASDGKPYTGDTLTVACSGSTFSSAGPGTGIGVTAGTFTLGGASAGNYTLTQPALSLSADILASAVWNVDADGLWSDSANWLQNIIPDGSGVAVDFHTTDQSADTTVTLDSNRSVGSVTFGNTNPVNWTLNSSGGVLTMAGAAPTITVLENAATVSAVIAGTNGVIKDGTGTLILSANSNTFSGGLTVQQGTVNVNGTWSQSTMGTAGITIQSGATVNKPDGGGGGVFTTLRGNLNLSGGTLAATGAPDGSYGNFFLENSGATYYKVIHSGDTQSVVSAALHMRGTHEFSVADGAAATDLLVSGRLGNEEGYTWAYINKTGAGTMAISSMSNSIGGLTISGGKVILQGALPGFASSGITNNAALEIDTTSGSGTFGRAISGSGTFAKTGTGTLTLSVASSYTGTTAVNEGTLLVNAANASSATTVAGTLGGTGILSGTVTAAGTLSPGTTGAGTLHTGAATLTGTYACDVDGALCDVLDVTGDLDLNGATIQLGEVNPSTTSTYVIATYSGTLAALTTPPVITGLAGYTLDTATAGQIKVVKSGYDSWASGNGLTGGDAQPDADPDNDGIDNGIEFVIGGDPSGTGSDSNALLVAPTLDASYLNFVFRRTSESVSLNPGVEYSSDLATWTSADPGEPVATPVIITEDAEFYGAGIDRVTVSIPRALATGGRLFARLKAVVVP